MLSCGKTSDILVCKHCGTYADGMPDGYARPWEKRCKRCHKSNCLEEATVATLLDIVNVAVMKKEGL